MTEQIIGFDVPNWTPRPRPGRAPLIGRHCTVAPTDPNRDAAELHAAFSEDLSHRIWTYLPYGPFETEAAFAEWLRGVAAEQDPLFHTVRLGPHAAGGRAVGLASYLRINPEAGSIEVGHINMSPALQRTTAATEAMTLMMRQAFSLGYRRYEWKCDALNDGSRRAAERLGFTFEGVHRQASIYKNRNRDTAWFSVLDGEWPAIDRAQQTWLSSANFDARGRQRHGLGALIAAERRDGDA